MLKTLFFCFGIFEGISVVVCESFECHDDSAYEPGEGLVTELQFTWLGALQYIHVRDGNPHYFRVPRVCLITRLFVLSTAKDAADVPDGYALGNVVFPEYERDEKECKVTIQQLAKGVTCDPAVLLMPIADVLLHPEYKHFGVKSSVALLKLLTPLASSYMLPVCLPFRNFLLRPGKMFLERLFYVDFVDEVPRDFVEEEKEIMYLRMLPKERCLKHLNDSSLPPDRHICTSGCDLQSGAPTLVHEHTGHWNLFAIAEGGCPCADPLRSRGPATPSRHILMRPYVPWITTAISGQAIGSFSKSNPFGYGPMPRASYPLPKRAPGWLGHWWLGGIRCYDRGDGGADIYRFYHEIFDIYPYGQPYRFIYYLELHSAYGFAIVCVKVAMPYQYDNPIIWGINTVEVKVRIPLVTFVSYYRIVVTAWCNNGTDPKDEEDDEQEGTADDEDEYSDETELEYVYDLEENRGWYKKIKDQEKKKSKDREKGKAKGDNRTSTAAPNLSDLSDTESFTPPYISDEPND